MWFFIILATIILADYITTYSWVNFYKSHSQYSEYIENVDICNIVTGAQDVDTYLTLVIDIFEYILIQILVILLFMPKEWLCCLSDSRRRGSEVLVLGQSDVVTTKDLESIRTEGELLLYDFD